MRASTDTHDLLPAKGAGRAAGRWRGSRPARYAMLAATFFLISFGLGFATLNRYSPATTEGLGDASGYAALTSGDGGNLGSPRRYRLLVPTLARPILQLSRGRLGSWDPVFFALLVVNSAFVGLTALVLVHLGERTGRSRTVALAGGLLFLLNFGVANAMLAGLVDGAEAFFLVCVVWAALGRRWAVLPLLGLAGAATKETFVPLSAAMVLVFCAWEWRRGTLSRAAVASVAGMFAAELLGLCLVRLGADGVFGIPPAPAALGRAPFLPSLAGALLNRGMLLTFVWLLPLGLPRVRRLPREWVTACAAACVVAALLGAWIASGPNLARGLFDVAGPLLSLAAAELLAGSPDTADAEAFRAPAA